MKFSNHRPNRAGLSVFLAAALLVVLAAPVQADVVEEVTAAIIANNDFARENLRDEAGGLSKDGMLSFWSSGGLLQRVPADADPGEYDAYNLAVKHLEVVPLGDDAAVAMYYGEGSFTPKGANPVNHYMTRITEVYVKEDGNWVMRASHYSPIASGSGTNQVAVD